MSTSANPVAQVASTPNATRKASAHIAVWCLPAEKARIEANAKAAGLSASRYLRDVGLGMPIRGVLDHEAVLALAKVNADQGRLGGLLKMWLSNNERLSGPRGVQVRALIEEILDDIGRAQGELLSTVQSVRGG